MRDRKYETKRRVAKRRESSFAQTKHPIGFSTFDVSKQKRMESLGTVSLAELPFPLESFEQSSREIRNINIRLDRPKWEDEGAHA